MKPFEEKEEFRVIIRAQDIIFNFMAETKKELIEKISFISRALIVPEEDMMDRKGREGYYIENEGYKRKIIVSIIESDLTAFIFPICDLANWVKHYIPEY